MGEVVLKISNINKHYGTHHVLQDINMEIKKGAIYGFIGRNGAGKTTLMKVICGLANADDGQLELFGQANNLSVSRKRVGVIIENPTLYKGLNAFDNLEIQRRLLGKVDKRKISSVLEMVGLSDVGTKRVKDYSLGMKQRLALAVALLNKPDLLILDEPINGLDPMGIIEIRHTLKKLSGQGVTILISSHILAELHLLATDFGIIEGGKMVKQLTAKQLDTQCQHHIELETTNDVKACELLQSQFGKELIKQKNAQLIITDASVETEELINILSEARIRVKKINHIDQDLESYFLNVIGGTKHV